MTAADAVDAVPDGRRARRERNRAAVIDAMFELLEEGHLPPAVDDVARRADVSVSSVFRYFENLDDLQQQTVERYFARFESLFEVPGGGEAPEDRVTALVDARLDLYERIAPIARMARGRLAEDRIAATLHATRHRFSAQVTEHFAPDVSEMGAAEAADRLSLIDALTSFEAWDLMSTTHGRSRRRIRRAWVLGVAALLGGR